MKRSQKAEMKQLYDELDTVEGMEKTYTSNVDYPEDVPVLEEFSEEDPIEDEEEYSEEEISLFLENVDFKDSKDKNGLSFDDMMPKRVTDTGVKMQLKENTVTPHFLVLREHVERTPSVCNYRDCFYDGAKAIKYKNWHKVPEGKKKIALRALEIHVNNEHKFQDTDIIDKSQIPTSYLSPTF